MANTESNQCDICGCALSRGGSAYATPTLAGRAHASRHHYVAERFFGRSKNTKHANERLSVFSESPWPGQEGRTGTFCYECHELILHNPVLLKADVEAFAALVKIRKLSEAAKTESRTNLAGRIQLLHEVIEAGLHVLSRQAAIETGSASSRPT